MYYFVISVSVTPVYCSDRSILLHKLHLRKPVVIENGKSIHIKPLIPLICFCISRFLIDQRPININLNTRRNVGT